MAESRPKLRSDIEVIPTRYQGERGIIVKDSLGLIRDPVFLHENMIEFLRLIDGRKTITDIQLQLIRSQKGLFVGADDVNRIVSELDRSFLLDSEKYRQAKNRLITDYSALKTRKAYLAGKAYPAAAEALNDYLESILMPDAETVPDVDCTRIRALVAPHIDIEVGKKVYAQAYRPLKGLKPRRIVLLGTGHHIQGTFLSLTQKDFETPLGAVKTDKQTVADLTAAGNGAVAGDDFVHRSEHSLEFQLIFCQHLFGQNFTLIPILCGGFEAVLNSAKRASEISGVGSFLGHLKQLFEDDSGSTLIVAGVDFSHVGPKFGHGQTASALIPRAEAHDRELIAALTDTDPLRFWAAIEKVRNEYNVCGFSPLACLLDLVPEAEGRLLGYDIWKEEATQSAVSFAALAFTEGG